MKSCLLLLLLLWPLDGAGQFRGAAVMKDLAAEMSVNAETQERFAANYPDLKDEIEAVISAARALAREGMAARDVAGAAEAVAERTRAMLARRTPQEWQRKAVSLFPQLGVAGSEFNTLFLQRHAELQRTSPQFVEEPSWPVLLARRCADELNARSQTTASPPSTSQPPSAPETITSAAPARRAGFWSSFLNLVLLLAIIVQPAFWLWRCSRAFAGHGTPITLWQRALTPAAWTYLGFALIALLRTFSANADQVFIDRFGITLLVSLLAGLLFALPGYGVSLAVMAWRRRPAPIAMEPRI